ncbi:alcohol dehydrogenase, putative [Entamoeba invadens IP1]|uniref:alcohol dehydrogenase, putative n=1 Tax=Entamoeba invadens IP1 TaxID=370355 RepID=UPI0002C3ECD3|nr:alcohol dehydrogenase, putative [Entamoeba invadens IP1]ELP93001.1 alcohol dehydrogenase, putative [Entamoeba invadens IP1]|eukprot:XP_004259772.1 alcohol dehydrogenase, putative [Entamoeba invadens IP1]
MELYKDLYTTKVVQGNLSDNLSKIQLGKKPLIVTTSHSSDNLGIIKTLTDFFTTQHVVPVIYRGITPNPLYVSCEECVDLIKKEHCDYVVGIGGGSAVDAAKSVCMMAKGVDVLTQSGVGLPLVCILTLSGSGTEVTPYSILTLPNGSKKSVMGHLFPTVSIIDKTFQATIPPLYRYSLIADIMSHCVESLLSVKATPQSSAASLDGMKMIYRDVSTFDITTIDTINASIIGGAAITVAGTSVPHGLGYYMTTKHNLPHGFACAVFSEAFLRLCEKQAIVGDRLRDACKSMHITCSQLELFMHTLVSKYGEVVVQKDELEVICNEFFGTGKDHQHPVPLVRDDVLEIIKMSVKLE